MSEIFFDEIKAYIGFDESDAVTLRALSPHLKPHFADIVNAFYTALNANPRSRHIFDGEAQIERLRRTLIVWLDGVFGGVYDEPYFQQRLNIGRVHVNVGLQPHFMFGAMNVIRRELLTRIAATHGPSIPDAAALCAAQMASVEKILDIELTIMLQSYWDNMMRLKLQIPTALATGLAHEIRNPLNAINLNITLLERRLRQLPSDTDELTPILEVMRSELRRIRGLTSEIMDFAKPVEIRPRVIDARELLAQFTAAHGPTLDVSQIALNTELSGPTTMWCDADRMSQILLNLVTNAVEAIGERGTITIRVLSSAKETRLEIEDTGEGMPPGMRYQIFDLFFTTKAAGTGLGLPIVRKIIEAHDGLIDLYSRPGHGTRFTISLPRPAHLAAQDAPQEEP